MLVAGLEPGSPAKRAGLEEGDVIVAFKDKTVSQINELHRHLVAAVIGIPAPITVFWRTEKIHLTIIPEELAPANQRN